MTIVPGNSANTSKSKVTGQKRKRYCFSDVQTTFIEVQVEKGNLDRPEGRQKVADDFTKDTKKHFPVEIIIESTHGFLITRARRRESLGDET